MVIGLLAALFFITVMVSLMYLAAARQAPARPPSRPRAHVRVIPAVYDQDSRP
jgi:hypothetical protein